MKTSYGPITGHLRRDGADQGVRDLSRMLDPSDQAFLWFPDTALPAVGSETITG